MPTRRGRLLDRGGANPVDLDAAALDETARLRRGGHPPRFLDHLPQRPPRRLGRQTLGVFERVGRNIRIQPRQRFPNALTQNDFAVVGTLGGSLAHADPAADWINTLRALDAEFLVASPGGERVVPGADWMAGAFTTALDADEILSAVRIRRLSPTARWSYYKFNRKPGEFAEAIAVFIDDSANRVCRAVIGALDGPPHLIANARDLIDTQGRDMALLDAHLDDAGLASGTYEYQVHRVALMRAAQIIREHGRNPQ